MDRRWKLFLISGMLSAVADQATKIYARAKLPTNANGDGLPVSVIDNFWDWQLQYNTGSAFSMFGEVPGARIFLSVIGIIALGAIVWMLRKTKPDQTRLIYALGMVAGGAVGNLIDRIAMGKVTDFVVWRYFEKRWPTFNVADVVLVVGVGILFLDMGKLEDDKDKKRKKGKKAAALQDSAKPPAKDAKRKKKKKADSGGEPA